MLGLWIMLDLRAVRTLHGKVLIRVPAVSLRDAAGTFAAAATQAGCADSGAAGCTFQPSLGHHQRLDRSFPGFAMEH